MHIITDKIVFGGNSISKIDGKTVFIPYAIPGEKLDINITAQKRDYDTAQIVSIIEPSKHRVEPVCPYYQKCGGCNMMHIEPSYQRELRLQILSDIFMQNGINLSGKIKLIYGPDFNYRARFQLNDGGLSEKSSNRIIPVEGCACAEKPVNDWLGQTSAGMRHKGRTHLFGSCFMKHEENNSRESVGGNSVVKNDARTTQGQIVVCDEQAAKKSGVVTKGGTKGKKLKLKENHYFTGTVITPQNTVTVSIGGKELCFDVRGFFQSNLFVFEKVVKLICDTLGDGENVLDMYAGCGSISAFLTDKFKNVVLVEHNRDALVFAEKNLSGKKHQSFGLSGANWVKNCAGSAGSFDACVVDPPRSGMEKEVCDYLCKSGIPQSWREHQRQDRT